MRGILLLGALCVATFALLLIGVVSWGWPPWIVALGAVWGPMIGVAVKQQKSR